MANPSLETRQVVALEAIAQGIADRPGSDMDVIITMLANQTAAVAKAVARAKEGGNSSVFDGWPTLPFTVTHDCDPDEIDRHITVKVTNDSGVYFVFTETGELLDVNMTKYG